MFHYIFRVILRILRKNLDLWPLYPASENIPCTGLSLVTVNLYNSYFSSEITACPRYLLVTKAPILNMKTMACLVRGSVWLHPHHRPLWLPLRHLLLLLPALQCTAPVSTQSDILSHNILSNWYKSITWLLTKAGW